MSLNDLPAKLTARVISHLAELEQSPIGSRNGLSRHAPVSVNLQHAIERLQFSNLTITSDDIAAFEKLVSRSCSRRRALLQRLTFTPVLPAYGDNACARHERRADGACNDEAFLTAIKGLFIALNACDNVEKASPMRLLLGNPYAPTDPRYRGKETRAAQAFAVEIGNRKDLFDERFAHSYICPELSDDLPAVKRVTQFVVHGDGPRFVAPSSIFSLLKILPCVDDLTLSLYDEERKSPDLRKQLRVDFARALLVGQSGIINKVPLDYRHQGPSDHRFTNADMRDACDGSTHDTFSTSLRQYLSGCRQLTTVNLGGPICIDETFFWFSAKEVDYQWANLEHLHVDMSMVRPDGGWYFYNHPDFPLDEPTRRDGLSGGWDSDDEAAAYSDSASSDDTDDTFIAQNKLPPDDYDEYLEGSRTGDAYLLYFRTQPNEALERVFAAAAKAVRLMPKLRLLNVNIDVFPCPRTNMEPQPFQLAYEATGSRHLDLELRAAKLEWVAPSEWKMSNELEALWRAVLGPTGIIKYYEW